VKRSAILLGLMLEACQQASPPADNRTANSAAAANVSANVVEAQPPFAETPDAHPGASEPAPIPAKFRGIWAESQAVCAQLSHPSRLIISESSLRYPSFVLVADSVDLPTDASVAVKGRNKRTQAPIEAHFSIDVTGNILTDEAGGGAVRVNCP
jgi:hypothetical protein